MDNFDPRVRLALSAIEAYVKNGKMIEAPNDTPGELLSTKAGVFVCVKKNGDLRGCIGTIEPVCDCLAEEIISNAVSAAARDPRFLPVEPHELGSLECTVDILTAPEEVRDIRDLDPKRYGVIVENGHRRGLLLPDLEGVNTVEEQIDIARRKAYISPNESMKLYKFEVVRYH